LPLASELLKNSIIFSVFTLVHKNIALFFFIAPWNIGRFQYFFARRIKKKLDAKVFSFSHLTLTLSPHYRVKCRSRSLATDNNEFLPGSVCVSSKIINWIATNAIGNYHHSKGQACHITSFSFQHVLKMSFCSTNASSRRWHHLQTARSVTAWLKQPTRCWCIISVCQLTILK